MLGASAHEPQASDGMRSYTPVTCCFKTRSRLFGLRSLKASERELASLVSMQASWGLQMKLISSCWPVK